MSQSLQSYLRDFFCNQRNYQLYKKEENFFLTSPEMQLFLKKIIVDLSYDKVFFFSL